MLKERTSIGLTPAAMRALERRAREGGMSRARVAAQYVELVLEGPTEWVRREWEARWGPPHQTKPLGK